MIFWKGSLNSYTNTIGKKRMIYIIKTKFNYGVQSEEKNTPNLRESPSFFHLIKCSQYYFNERAASHFNECIFFLFFFFLFFYLHKNENFRYVSCHLSMVLEFIFPIKMTKACSFQHNCWLRCICPLWRIHSVLQKMLQNHCLEKPFYIISFSTDFLNVT